MHHSASTSSIPLKTASADEILDYSAQVLSRFNKANERTEEDAGDNGDHD